MKPALGVLAALLLTAACSAAGPSPALPSGTMAAPDLSPAPPASVPATPAAGLLTTLRPVGSVEGAPLGYAEHLPEGYGDGAPRPLLVYVHGGGEFGDGSADSLPKIFEYGVPRLIEDGEWPAERPFVVLMPQYPESEANDCLLADELREFFAFAIDHYGVDPTRIYLTGVSCGSIGVWDYLAADGDELVAATVQIAGHLESAWPQAGCDLGRVPTWVFHGAMDEVVPITYVEDAIDRMEACTPSPVDLRLTVYPDADHDSWSRTYDLSAGHDIYAWLLEHTNEPRP